MPNINLGKVVGADGVTPNIQINEVKTLDAGAEAYFERVEDSPKETPLFNVGIPRGAGGTTPNVQVGTTETLEPGSAAEVVRRAGSSNLDPVFDFKIPKGERGPQGTAPAKSFVVSESMAFGPPHANQQVIVNSDSDITITVMTAQLSPMEDYAEIEIFKLGTGKVTIIPMGGVTILCKEPSLVMTEQYTSAALKLLTAYDSTNNTWALQGAVGE